MQLLNVGGEERDPCGGLKRSLPFANPRAQLKTIDLRVMKCHWLQKK